MTLAIIEHGKADTGRDLGDKIFSVEGLMDFNTCRTNTVLSR